MNRITFPLTPQMKRPEVAQLHEALTFLGATIADTEKTAQRYGASTRAAVTKFQTAQQLPATGTVSATRPEKVAGCCAKRRWPHSMQSSPACRCAGHSRPAVSSLRSGTPSCGRVRGVARRC